MSNICNCISGKYRHAYNYIWLDEEGIKDLSQRVVFANSSKTANNKPVIQFDMNNNIVNRYGSVKKACERNKYKSPNISACCRGEQKTAYGYKWKYEGEDEYV